MAIKITDLKIDNKSLGDKFILADIVPTFEYKDGERTKNIDGYRYFVVLPKLKMEKLGVKVPHKTPIFDIEKEEVPIGTELNFENLEVGSFFMNGAINISAKADNVSVVGKNNAQK